MALCFVFKRACGVRRKRSELFVVVKWVCDINWQGTVSIPNFDIKVFLAFVLTHLCLLFLIIIQLSWHQPIQSFGFGNTVLWISTHVHYKSVPGFVF